MTLHLKICRNCIMQSCQNDRDSEMNVAVIKKPQQGLHSLQRPRNVGLPSAHLTTFYRGTIEIIPMYGFTSWLESCKAYEQKQLFRIVETAASAKQLSGTPTTPPIIFSLYCHQVRGTGASVAKLAEC